MKITVQEEPGLLEAEVVIRCPPGDPSAARLLSALNREASGKLTGWRDGQAYPLERRDVLYAEAVDKRTYLYTAGEVFETSLRLYELEEALGPEFLRASKSAVVNFDGVRSLRPDLGGRLRLTMSNGEDIYVSRRYALAVKEKLGI